MQSSTLMVKHVLAAGIFPRKSVCVCVCVCVVPAERSTDYSKSSED